MDNLEYLRSLAREGEAAGKWLEDQALQAIKRAHERAGGKMTHHLGELIYAYLFPLQYHERLMRDLGKTDYKPGRAHNISVDERQRRTKQVSAILGHAITPMKAVAIRLVHEGLLNPANN